MNRPSPPEGGGGGGGGGGGAGVLHVTRDLDIAGEGLHNVRDAIWAYTSSKEEMEDYCDL